MSEPPARKEFPLKQIGAALANLYARLQPKRSGATMPTPSATYEQDEAKTQKVMLSDTILTLDELPVTNTITRRWPLAKLNYPTFVRAEEPSLPPRLQSPLLPLPHQGGQTTRSPSNNDKSSSLAEDETEEMDALPGEDGKA